jgi:hypothetical protein
MSTGSTENTPTATAWVERTAHGDHCHSNVWVTPANNARWWQSMETLYTLQPAHVERVSVVNNGSVSVVYTLAADYSSKANAQEFLNDLAKHAGLEVTEVQFKDSTPPVDPLLDKTKAAKLLGDFMSSVLSSYRRSSPQRPW